MKILALEKEVEGVSWINRNELLLFEAEQIYNLYLSDIVREIYFTQNKNAVIVLDVKDKNEAIEILDSLPLVKSGMIKFEILELRPYTGFDRLMKPKSD